MTATTPLALAVDAREFTTVDAAKAVYRKEGATAGGRLGAVTFTASGGVGVKTARIKSQPAWAAALLNQSGDNTDVWTLGGDVGLPPYAGMEDRVVVEITDSATPTPAKKEATLILARSIPSDQTMYRSGDSESIIFTTAAWPVIYSKRLTSNADTLDFTARRHANGKVIFHAVFAGSFKHEEAVMVGPHWQTRAVCHMLYGPYPGVRCEPLVHQALNEYAAVAPPAAV